MPSINEVIAALPPGEQREIELRAEVMRLERENERLTEMRDYWHRMFWKERERALKAENALYALQGGETPKPYFKPKFMNGTGYGPDD